MNKYNVKIGWDIDEDERLIYAILTIYAKSNSEAKRKAISLIKQRDGYTEEDLTYIKCIKIGELK